MRGSLARLAKTVLEVLADTPFAPARRASRPNDEPHCGYCGGRTRCYPTIASAAQW
ncbi:MAG: hypothetical protein IJU72_07745 [Bacteroidales bacterium]|nr:hypothetical protein [Bacteroidales bacterium]